MSRSVAMKVGAFTIAAVVLFIVAVLLFADVRPWRSDATYWVRFPYTVTGLSEGSRVELWGVRVGEVSSIAIDGDRVRVGLRVHQDVGIPVDAQASLKFEGVTGLKFIDIERGDLGGPRLEPGQQIAAAPTDLGEAIDAAVSAATQLDELMRRASDVMDQLAELVGPANRARIAYVLDQAGPTMDALRQASGDLAEVTGSVRATTPELMMSLRASARSAARLTDKGHVIAEDLAAAAGNARQTSANLSAASEAVGQELRAVLFDVRATVATARSWMRGLEANPSRLLRSRGGEELPPP